MSDPTQLASLKPKLTDSQIRLALYALDSALESSGVFLEIDTSDLAPDLNYIQSLAPLPATSSPSICFSNRPSKHQTIYLNTNQERNGNP